MNRFFRRSHALPWKYLLVVLVAVGCIAATAYAAELGQEIALERHLANGEEFEVGIPELLAHGRAAFVAKWTLQEGGGRPLTTGTGGRLVDPLDPLVFPRNFNRISAPDANSCAGCHSDPFPGGAGDIVANVFVLGQRFDFATFDGNDDVIGKGNLNEGGLPSSLDDIANSRATTGMFGSGYLEMLARQMTADLQAARDGVAPGGSAALLTKGVSFGTLSRTADGSWDISQVEGLPDPSTFSDGPDAPPNLIVRPWHQAGAVVSLRQFTNNAMNHHHGMQTEERFGVDVDDDGDDFFNELTRADVTAVSVWQAALPVPGRVIPSDPGLTEAILNGEQVFASIGCADCHIAELPLDDWGWYYSEPNPYNPPGNLQVGEVESLQVNLNSKTLPSPRLGEDKRTRTTWVPAFTDLKLHDITSGPDDPNREKLNMHFSPGSEEFLEGNGKFLTKRLWGTGNTPPYFHHGKFVTIRQAIENHAGEAQAQHDAYVALSAYDQNSMIEFLKSLQVLPPGTKTFAIDDEGRPIQWPPKGRGINRTR